MAKLSFKSNSSPFFSVLRQKVDRYFKENKISRNGNTKLHLKGLLLISTAVSIYVTLVFFTPVSWLALPLCAFLGLVVALVGFNVMHEGAHNSYANNKTLNKLASYTLNCLGGNAYFWEVKHNYNHHTFTNIDKHDADIDIAPYMRQHVDHPYKNMHRYQHIYCLFLYAFSYFDWIFIRDFVKYFEAKITDDSPLNLTPREKFKFWATKITYFAVYVFFPMYMVGVLPYLVGFAVLTSVTGLVLGCVFQMAHVVELADFPMPEDGTTKIDQEWAIHQLSTTANFATKNKLVTWALGGLNFQVEHHLFPKINHIHYPVVSKLVKETCAEFNVPYLEYDSISDAFGSHLNLLKKLGRPLESAESISMPATNAVRNVRVRV